MSRDYRIDFLKGIAIFLVVLGHVLQYGLNDYSNNPIFVIIYSFHMPLFIFLSGYIAYFSFSKDKKISYIFKRFIQLMLPFVFWGVLVCFMESFLSYYKDGIFPIGEYLLNLLIVPEHGLWYLYVLFIFNIVHFLLSVIYKKIKTNYIKICIVIMSISLIVLLFLLPLPNKLGLINISFLAPFYGIGILMNYIKCKKSVDFKNKYLAIFLSVLMISCLVLVVIKNGNYYLNKGIIDSNYFFNILNKFIKFFIAFEISFTLFYLSGYINQELIINKYISNVGFYSLDIYIFQLVPTYLLIYLQNRINVYLYTYVLSLLISVLLIILIILFSKYIIRKVKILSLLCLGKYNIN